MDPGELLLYICSYFSLFTAILFFLTFFEQKGQLKNPVPKRYPSISVIVPAYNEERHITATIRSLLNLEYPKGKVEIIVIDDGSKDNTYAIACTFRKQGVKVFTKSNSGKGDTLNFGLKHAHGELIACLDADSIVHSSCLKKMVGYFNDPRVMAVTPSMKIHQPKGILLRIQQIEYLLGVYLRKVFAYLGSIHVTPGPFSIFRKEFFDTYGGYDTDNLTEDIEIAMRIQSKQYIIENSIDANVWTIGPKTFKGLLRQRLRWYVGFLDNALKYKHMFANRNYGNLGMFFLPGVFVSTALVIALFFYMIYKAVTTSYKQVLDLIAIRFDVWPLLKFRFDIFYLHLSGLAILSIIGLVTGITMLVLARRHSKDKDPVKVSFLLYLYVYLMLYAFWWLLSGLYKGMNWKLEWGKKVE